MSKILLVIIIMAHIAFIMFVLLTPLVGNEQLLILHVITVPFMMAHWYVNDNTCALTLLENHIRTKLTGVVPDNDETFMYRLIAPVYDFKKNNDDMSTIIYVITISMWLIACYRLYAIAKDKKVSNIKDFILLLGGRPHSHNPSSMLVDSEK